jgi:hypothetical protein
MSGQTLGRAGAVMLGASAVVAALGLAATTPVAAAQGDNRGDAWVDNVGQSQVGHETDPHLACSDIAIWADKLNDAGGPVAIQGWPPSGKGAGEVLWSGTWSYDTGSGGSQVIATVSASALVSAAQQAGDTAQPQQGYHFKLDLEDPRGNSIGDDKYKTFWVSCSVSSSVSTPTPTSGLQGTPTSSPASGVEGITSGPAGGTGGLVGVPSTGSALPWELAGGLAAGGLGLIGLGGRRRRRS